MTTHAEVWDGGAKAARDDTPSIYVACLASYNAGRLHGRWIAADQDAEDMHEEIRAMLAEGPTPGAEEWAIHDYEGFGPYTIHEYESIEKVAELAAGIAEHGEAFAIYASHVGSIEDATESFEDAYQGDYSSSFKPGEDFAAEFYEDIYGDGCAAPGLVVDWRATWENMFDFWEERGHIFRSV